MTTTTENAETNWFSRLNALNVNEKVEQKNGFSYLSWAWAHARMAELDPDFDWWPVEFDGMPFLKTPGGCFVKITVKFQGRERSHLFPVLDHRNKPIPEPSVFDINTSIMRGFVKCCALFGLGLYIYAGEDLPEDEVRAKRNREIIDWATKVVWTMDQDKDEADIAADCVNLHFEMLDRGQDFYLAVFDAGLKELDEAQQPARKAAFKKFFEMGRKNKPKVLPNGRAA